MGYYLKNNFIKIMDICVYISTYSPTSILFPIWSFINSEVIILLLIIVGPLRIELSPIVLQTIVRTSYTTDPIAEGVRIELTQGILTVCCPADRRTFILLFSR